jgi:ubiquitin-protein ligase
MSTDDKSIFLMSEKAPIEEILTTELNNLMKNENNVFSISQEDDIFTWNFVINDLNDLTNKNGICRGKIKFPEEYPALPPKVLITNSTKKFEDNSNFNEHMKRWDETCNATTALCELAAYLNRVEEEERIQKTEDETYDYLDMPKPIPNMMYTRRIIMHTDIPIILCFIGIIYIIFTF